MRDFFLLYLAAGRPVCLRYGAQIVDHVGPRNHVSRPGCGEPSVSHPVVDLSNGNSRVYDSATTTTHPESPLLQPSVPIRFVSATAPVNRMHVGRGLSSRYVVARKEIL